MYLKIHRPKNNLDLPIPWTLVIAKFHFNSQEPFTRPHVWYSPVSNPGVKDRMGYTVRPCHKLPAPTKIMMKRIKDITNGVNRIWNQQWQPLLPPPPCSPVSSVMRWRITISTDQIWKAPTNQNCLLPECTPTQHSHTSKGSKDRLSVTRFWTTKKHYL